MAKPDNSFASYAMDLAIRGLLRLALALPYPRRIAFFGWVTARVISPIAGYNRRIRENLDYILPNITAAERKKIIRGVPDNIGRTVIEIYSGQEFINRIKDIPLSGAGASILREAHANNRPVILATGHIGNYDVARGALIGRGYRVGGLYRPMQNVFFNQHYERAIGKIGSPMFARGRRGLAEMVKFLKSGGMVGFVTDQHVHKGTPLPFLGKPAATALSAAQLALKYDTLLVPIYGVRQKDGLDFKIIVEAPIPHTDAETMTRALNDSLEALVRAYPEQWLWIHRRWKPDVIERQRKRAAAKI